MSTAGAQAAGCAARGPSTATVPAKAVDVREHILRHLTISGIAPQQISAGPENTAEQTAARGQVAPPAPTPKLTKSQRRNRLQILRDTSNVDEARRLTKDILAEWAGKGLHVYEALRLLAKFQGETARALEMFCETLDKLVVSWALEENTRQIWLDINRGSGRASRYLKRADTTLAELICLHWQPILKTGGVDPTKWISLLLRSGATFCALSRQLPMPEDMVGKFNGRKQILLPTSSILIFGIHQYQCSRTVAYKVAGDHLPVELVELIADHLTSRSMWSRFVHKYFELGTTVRLRWTIRTSISPTKIRISSLHVPPHVVLTFERVMRILYTFM